MGKSKKPRKKRFPTPKPGRRPRLESAERQVCALKDFLAAMLQRHGEQRFTPGEMMRARASREQVIPEALPGGGVALALPEHRDPEATTDEAMPPEP